MINYSLNKHAPIVIASRYHSGYVDVDVTIQTIDLHPPYKVCTSVTLI